ncbi:MAG: hypothetical protein MUF34_20125 [Polyangiaceae bacterium]|nr:hypothetical protein [Polyangiaceae bacterium]
MASHTINQEPGGVKLACPICALLRAAGAGAGACSTHVVHDDWRGRGYPDPWTFAAVVVRGLGEALGEALPDPLAFVGSACVARLRTPRAIEAEARRADATDRGLLSTLGTLSYQAGGDA